MRFLLLISIAVILFSACEEVIEIDINSADPKLIIEAKISNLENDNIVQITESTDFYNPNEYTKVSGAEVLVSDSDGNGFVFEETSPGLYKSNDLIGVPNKEYSISIIYLEESYTAFSEMPEGLVLDSISYKEEEGDFRDGGGVSYQFHCFFRDRPDVNDYARFKVYNNGKQINGIFLYDDKLTDGNYVDFFRFSFQDVEIIPGDSITFELITIDRNIHLYFNTLESALAESTGGGPFGSQSPANPVTNWDNDAFGYFSAHTVSRKTIVIE